MIGISVSCTEALRPRSAAARGKRPSTHHRQPSAAELLFKSENVNSGSMALLTAAPVKNTLFSERRPATTLKGCRPHDSSNERPPLRVVANDGQKKGRISRDPLVRSHMPLGFEELYQTAKQRVQQKRLSGWVWPEATSHARRGCDNPQEKPSPTDDHAMIMSSVQVSSRSSVTTPCEPSGHDGLHEEELPNALVEVRSACGSTASGRSEACESDFRFSEEEQSWIKDSLGMLANRRSALESFRCSRRREIFLSNVDEQLAVVAPIDDKGDAHTRNRGDLGSGHTISQAQPPQLRDLGSNHTSSEAEPPQLHDLGSNHTSSEPEHALLRDLDAGAAEVAERIKIAMPERTEKNVLEKRPILREKKIRRLVAVLQEGETVRDPAEVLREYRNLQWQRRKSISDRYESLKRESILRRAGDMRASDEICDVDDTEGEHFLDGSGQRTPPNTVFNGLVEFSPLATSIITCQDAVGKIDKIEDPAASSNRG